MSRPYTYSTDVPSGLPVSAANPVGVQSSLYRPFAKRLAPPRDVTWELNRVRLGQAVTQQNPTIKTYPRYVVYSGLRNIGSNQPAKHGVFPVAGVWLNTISRDNEILWVGCVPPGRSEYAPQFPVIVTEADFLICGVADAADYYNNDFATDTFFSVRFSFDVTESVKT